MGKQQKPYVVQDQLDFRGCGVAGESGHEEETFRNGSNIEEDKLMEHTRGSCTGKEKSGETLAWNSGSVGVEDFTSQRVECTLNTLGKEWWATKTRAGYSGILEEFTR